MLVMAVLGLLSVIAIPHYYDFQEEAKRAREKAIVGTIQSGIITAYSDSMISGNLPTFPTTLDGASLGPASDGNPLFTAVLQPYPVTDEEWIKASGVIYKAPTAGFYYYESSAGRFVNTGILGETAMEELEIDSEDIDINLINQLLDQNKVAFPDGKILVGGGGVIIPAGGGEPMLIGEDTGEQTFTFSQGGNVNLEIIDEYAGYAPYFTFGYYAVDMFGNKTLHQLFNGPDSVGDLASFTVTPGQEVGFYITTPQGNGYIYYSNASENIDGFDHMHVHHNKPLRKITVGVEDLFGGGDQDFQDFIVTMSYD